MLGRAEHIRPGPVHSVKSKRNIFGVELRKSWRTGARSSFLAYWRTVIFYLAAQISALKNKLAINTSYGGIVVLFLV